MGADGAACIAFSSCTEIVFEVKIIMVANLFKL